MPEKKKERNVRIVLVGEPKSGKTSIVIAFISDSFQESVIELVPPVTVPPSVGGEKDVTTFLIDTSSTNKEKTDNEIENADVICIVHPASNPHSTTPSVALEQSVKSWTDRIRTVRKETNNHWSQKVPVMVIISKCDDKAEDGMDSEETANLDKIIEEHPEIVNCIETSSKNLGNISEIVSLAIQAVLYPPGPLVENNGNLREKAFKRIFQICDKDGDHKLDRSELSSFQKYSFGEALTADQERELIEHIRENADEDKNYLDNEDKVTYDGFQFIIKELVEAGSYKSLWACAKAFGYNDSLDKLRSDFKFPPNLDPKQEDQLPTELSKEAHNFLSKYIERFKSSGLIPADRFKSLMELTPREERVVLFDELGLEMDQSQQNYKFQGFKAAFDCMMKLKPRNTLFTLAYLGFGHDSNPNGVAYIDRFSRKKKNDPKKEIPKSVFEVVLVGKKESGRSTLMSRLINYPTDNNHVRPFKVVANQFQFEKKNYTLIVHDDEGRANEADLTCVLIDATDKEGSVRHANDHFDVFHGRRKENPPKTLFLVTKADRTASKYAEVKKDIEEKLKNKPAGFELFFVNLNSSSPYSVVQYSKSGPFSQPTDLSKLFISRVLRDEEFSWKNGIIIGAVTVAVGVGAYLVYRYLKKEE